MIVPVIVLILLGAAGVLAPIHHLTGFPRAAAVVLGVAAAAGGARSGGRARGVM